VKTTHPTRRHWWEPRTFRLRLAVLFAALFLAAGSALVVATYVLVEHNLPVSSPSRLPPHYVRLCKQLIYQSGPSKTAPASNATPSGAQVSKDSKISKSQADKCRLTLLAASKAGSLDQRQRALSGLLTTSLLGLAFLTLVAGAIGWLISKRILRPVRAITDTARRASDENLGERLSVEGPDDELKELATTFDAMLDRLDNAFVGQRRFVANASHELRTPLTAMRTAVDVTLAKPQRSSEDLEAMAHRVRRSIDKADLIVEALLTLAVSQQGLQKVETVDVAALARNALDASQSLIVTRRLQVEQFFEPSQVFGDAVLLERLVANVVENAVVHNVDDGWIRIRTGRSDGATFLSVANGGPQLDEALVPRLIEPFNRANERLDPMGGVGLGLALVQSIATLHAAVLEIHALPDGGLEVRVRFADVATEDS